MEIRNKLYFYSFCFLCCVSLEELVNSAGKIIGGSCNFTPFIWEVEKYCFNMTWDWGKKASESSGPIHTDLCVVSNFSKRRIWKSRDENMRFYWGRYLENPKETLGSRKNITVPTVMSIIKLCWNAGQKSDFQKSYTDFALEIFIYLLKKSISIFSALNLTDLFC